MCEYSFSLVPSQVQGMSWSDCSLPWKQIGISRPSQYITSRLPTHRPTVIVHSPDRKLGNQANKERVVVPYVVYVCKPLLLLVRSTVHIRAKMRAKHLLLVLEEDHDLPTPGLYVSLNWNNPTYLWLTMIFDPSKQVSFLAYLLPHVCVQTSSWYLPPKHLSLHEPSSWLNKLSIDDLYS